MEIKFRLWIDNEDQVVAGSGRVRLLEAIKEHGSITKAAKEMEISYKKAWKLIDSLNNAADQALVSTNAGGKGGGGTIITEKGETIIQQFNATKKAFQQLAHELQASLIH